MCCVDRLKSQAKADIRTEQKETPPKRGSRNIRVTTCQPFGTLIHPTIVPVSPRNDPSKLTGSAYHLWNQSYAVDGMMNQAIVGRGYGGRYLGIFPTLNTVVVLNNEEWGDPRERVFDYDVIVEKWILPALR